MKNFDSIFAAYLVFWAIVFVYDFAVARRLSRAEDDLARLRDQLDK